MKKFFLMFGILVAVQALAGQFTNIYRTIALCTDVKGVEYCHIKKTEDVFAVMNYREDAGRIMFHGKDYSEYVPVGTASQEENKNGISVWSNDYKSVSSDASFFVMYSTDNMWFLSDLKDSTYCFVVKYWARDAKGFRETYKFKEISSIDKFREMVDRCRKE